MNQANTETEAAEADISPTRSLSKIWIVPIVALLVAAWMVYYQWSNQGPLIEIEFTSAYGLETGKTKIKARNVDVGEVKNIKLKENNDGVIVSARISQDARHLIKEDSNFWVVTPRVSLSGVSGLATLLSGPYIELDPGMSGEEQTRFVGLDEPPLTPAGTPGLFITLNSDDKFAFERGDPVIYKGLTVGQFEDIYFNFEQRIVYYNVFVEAPYHQLITENTRFWNASGVRVDLKSDGLSVQTGNVETLLTNGVSFGVPEGMPWGDRITDREYFDVYPSYELASAARYRMAAKYIIMISDTVRGLNVGAPVEYRGLQVGQVLDVDIKGPHRTSLLEEGYRIPVMISVQPGRVGLPDNEQGLQHVREQTDIWLNKGFRASLKTGNLLTGAQFVELQFYDNQPNVEPETFMGYEVLPTVSDEFTQITHKITAILDQVNALPFAELSTNANTMMLEFIDTAQSFREASDAFDDMAADFENQELVDTLTQTLATTEQLMRDYSADSATYENLNQSMQQLIRTMNDLKPLMLQLNSSPNSLIFTGKSEAELEPKGRNQ